MTKHFKSTAITLFNLLLSIKMALWYGFIGTTLMVIGRSGNYISVEVLGYYLIGTCFLVQIAEQEKGSPILNKIAIVVIPIILSIILAPIIISMLPA